MSKGPFRFDQVGSLLRTTKLKQAKEAVVKKEITQVEYKEIEREEIAKIVLKQREIGMKAISDGEFNRAYWHYDFISFIDGIENYVLDTNGSFQGVLHSLPAYYVKDRLSFPIDHPFLEDYQYLQSLLEGNEVAKFTIPGPNMIYFSGVLNSAKYKENTNIHDLEVIKQDIAKVYQDAIQSFYDAGCRYLQFDDTSWGVLFCESQRKKLEEKGIDTQQLVKDFGDISVACIKNKPKDLILTTHCCRGNFKSSWLYEGDYKFVEKDIFRANFDGFFLEFDNERSGSFEPIKHLKHGKLVLGLLTSKDGKMESKENVKARILEASKYLPLDQLCLSCQCGFSSTEDGNTISESEQFSKLKLVEEIAKEVWKDA